MLLSLDQARMTSRGRHRKGSLDRGNRPGIARYLPVGVDTCMNECMRSE